jgi:hypothetical protein
MFTTLSVSPFSRFRALFFSFFHIFCFFEITRCTFPVFSFPLSERDCAVNKRLDEWVVQESFDMSTVEKKEVKRQRPPEEAKKSTRSRHKRKVDEAVAQSVMTRMHAARRLSDAGRASGC